MKYVMCGMVKRGPGGESIELEERGSLLQGSFKGSV